MTVATVAASLTVGTTALPSIVRAARSIAAPDRRRQARVRITAEEAALGGDHVGPPGAPADL
ncbi:hypothetical protein, partial [Streptomyces shenzhenensis]|uniref:hypothetical protein n=1 Tax=Streptomyces shenzhenensis TaxID=943815 RepID=UPI0033C4AE23